MNRWHRLALVVLASNGCSSQPSIVDDIGTESSADTEDPPGTTGSDSTTSGDATTTAPPTSSSSTSLTSSSSDSSGSSSSGCASEELPAEVEFVVGTDLVLIVDTSVSMANNIFAMSQVLASLQAAVEDPSTVVLVSDVAGDEPTCPGPPLAAAGCPGGDDSNPPRFHRVSAIDTSQLSPAAAAAEALAAGELDTLLSPMRNHQFVIVTDATSANDAVTILDSAVMDAAPDPFAHRLPYYQLHTVTGLVGGSGCDANGIFAGEVEARGGLAVDLCLDGGPDAGPLWETAQTPVRDCIVGLPAPGRPVLAVTLSVDGAAQPLAEVEAFADCESDGEQFVVDHVQNGLALCPSVCRTFREATAAEVMVELECV